MMKKFLAIYHAPAAAMAAMATATEEQKAAGMIPWMQWKEKVGEQVVDFGAPVMGGQNLGADGNWSNSSREVTGYSIVQANSFEDAKALFEGHPHISWSEGCTIEVHEAIAM